MQASHFHFFFYKLDERRRKKGEPKKKKGKGVLILFFIIIKLAVGGIKKCLRCVLIIYMNDTTRYINNHTSYYAYKRGLDDDSI